MVVWKWQGGGKGGRKGLALLTVMISRREGREVGMKAGGRVWELVVEGKSVMEGDDDEDDDRGLFPSKIKMPMKLK